MTEFKLKTSERITPENFETEEEYLLYLRHVFAYGFAKDHIPRNSFVLEVGCGEGYGTKLLSENVTNIIGLDVDKDAVAHAQAKYGSENCLYNWYDGHRIPFEDNRFDAVISFQVIEHIRDDENYISEVCRVLKINGIFILTTPNGTLRIRRGQKPWNPFHVREYFPDELGHLLKRNFSGVKVWGIHGNEEVQGIELARVKRSLRIISYDPLNIRKIIPGSIKQLFARFLRSITSGKQSNKSNKDFVNKFSMADYHISESDAGNSLDLLCILKKSS